MRLSSALPSARRPSIRIGVARGILPGERRVAATPESVLKLRELGFEVLVEKSAGTGSGIADEAYTAAGATLVDTADAVWKAVDIIAKVRPPTPEEASQARPGTTLISLLQPERHPELPPVLQSLKLSAIALERIPRITRAQKMDVLSSMANLAGYRAVVEAAQHYQGFFSPQVTAAGHDAAGAGARHRRRRRGARRDRCGALRSAPRCRAFDTRPATEEQVESLGAEFLDRRSRGETAKAAGGYAKEMSPEFIEAEMALFRAQAAGGRHHHHDGARSRKRARRSSCPRTWSTR